MKVITEKKLCAFGMNFAASGAYAKKQVPDKSAKLYFTKGSSFTNIADNEVDAVMNKLNHRLEKHSTLKHLMQYFLLSHCKKPHE